MCPASHFPMIAGPSSVVCCELDSPGNTSYLLYNCSSQVIRTISDEHDCSDPSWTLIAGNKLASAQFASFKIWDLSSGQAVATAGPDLAAVQDHHYHAGGGQVAADFAGSKLAFCPAVVPRSVLTVHVYDAETLQLLACLRPEAGLLSAEPHSRNSAYSALFWGVRGWMLAYRPPNLQSRVMGHLQMIAPQAGCDTYRHVILQGCQPRRAPAVSLDAAFVALFAHEGAKLEIKAVSSGQLMLTRAVGGAKECASSASGEV